MSKKFLVESEQIDGFWDRANIRWFLFTILIMSLKGFWSFYKSRFRFFNMFKKFKIFVDDPVSCDAVIVGSGASLLDTVESLEFKSLESSKAAFIGINFANEIQGINFERFDFLVIADPLVLADNSVVSRDVGGPFASDLEIKNNNLREALKMRRGKIEILAPMWKADSLELFLADCEGVHVSGFPDAIAPIFGVSVLGKGPSKLPPLGFAFAMAIALRKFTGTINLVGIDQDYSKTLWVDQNNQLFVGQNKHNDQRFVSTKTNVSVGQFLMQEGLWLTMMRESFLPHKERITVFGSSSLIDFGTRSS